MDKHRTDYVFHKPRRARERHVIWLPVDIAARYGFVLGALLLVLGGIGTVVSFTSKSKADADTLWYSLGIAVLGVVILVVLNWLQRQGRPMDRSDGIIRRTRPKGS